MVLLYAMGRPPYLRYGAQKDGFEPRDGFDRRRSRSRREVAGSIGASARIGTAVESGRQASSSGYVAIPGPRRRLFSGVVRNALVPAEPRPRSGGHMTATRPYAG